MLPVINSAQAAAAASQTDASIVQMALGAGACPEA